MLKVFLVERVLKEFRGVKVLLVQSLDLKVFKVFKVPKEFRVLKES